MDILLTASQAFLTDWRYLALVSLFLVYKYTTRNHNYWKKRGIPGPPPLPFFGNSLDFLLKPIGQIERERYQKYGPVYGLYEKQTPVLVVGDPELLKRIMVKDWHAFINRRPTRTVDDVFSKNLLALRDDKWKSVRALVSPTFTSGKIRKMTPTIEDCVQGVLDNLEESCKSGSEVDLKRLFGAYTMDVIASCAFATKTNAHKNPNDPFLKNAYDFFRPSTLRLLMAVALPYWLRKIFTINFVAPEVLGFFSSFSKHVIKERKKSGQRRNDFVQLLVDAESSANLSEDIKDISGGHFSSENAEDIETNAKLLNKSNNNNVVKKLTDDEAAGQAFVFLIAGYETTGSLLLYCGYVLATHQDVQEKLYQEIRGAVKNDYQINYEDVTHLDYLNAVISETLRLYSPILRMDREAGEDYDLGNVVIPKNMIVILPFYALHHDPKHFPEPDSFRPERFTKENVAEIQPYTYMPFGAGPRNCIGMRFALWEAKMALCKVLLKYQFVKSTNTDVPLKFRKSSFVLQAENVVVGVQKRN